MRRGLAVSCTPPTIHWKNIFFSISIDHLWPNSSQIRGHKKKLLPSSYSNGALKMCNICFCKYCARICFKAICILLIFDKISFLIQIEQNKPWCIKIRRVGQFYKKKTSNGGKKNVLIFACKLCAEVLL